MSSSAKANASRHNTTVQAAKNIIDDLANQLEEADKKVRNLTQENKDLQAENNSYEFNLTSLTTENAKLLREKGFVNDHCAEQRRIKEKYFKKLSEERKKNAALEKALLIAKKMASLGPRVTFKTFLEAQEEFRQAVEVREKAESEGAVAENDRKSGDSSHPFGRLVNDWD